MFGLQETLQTYSYDDHDNIIEEHYEEAGREGSVGRGGRLTTRNETSRITKTLLLQTRLSSSTVSRSRRSISRTLSRRPNRRWPASVQGMW
jgi:hypothetical protein